jgi:hypothetical protein
MIDARKVIGARLVASGPSDGNLDRFLATQGLQPRGPLAGRGWGIAESTGPARPARRRVRDHAPSPDPEAIT